ncbi:MAG TPA: phosphopantetheine-binding protein, partial [Thermoanaerobaculia bacterium]
ARFQPDPHANEPGARLYRTGDLGRLRSDGVFEFLGRLDGQVKVRGFRVETGEIEAARLRQPAVAAAAVTVARERLVAFVVLAEDDAAGSWPEALRAALRATLPEPLVPAIFAPLAALPLSPNGKVDRRALTALAERLPEALGAARPAPVPPRNAVEELLAGIWSELLGVEPIGVYDNFFDLGGHSLQAIRVTSRLRDALGIDLAVAALFAAPTLEGLAAAVTDALVAQLGEDEVVEILGLSSGA